MNSYDEDRDRRRRRRNPFDIFGFDDDFIRDLLDDDRVMDDFRRMAEEMMKMFSGAQPGKPIVHGFKIRFDSDGRPKIEDFGNKHIKSPNGEPLISEEREPLTDIIEGDDDVAVTVEIPGVEKNDVDLNVTGDTLEIKVATYKNGILDIVIKRKEKKKPGSGYKVNIE